MCLTTPAQTTSANIADELKKMRSINPDDLFTVNSLVAYVESALPELTYKKWGYEQIPQKSLVGEDFQVGAIN